SSASPQMSIPSPINDEDDKEKKLDDFLNRVTKEKVSPEIQVNTSNKVCPPISILPNCVLFSDNDVDAGYYYDLNPKDVVERDEQKRLKGHNEVPASQDQDLSLVNQDASTGSEKTITSLSLCDAKTVTKCHDLNNSDTTSEILESDNQIVEGDSKTVTKCHDQINVEVSILPEKVSPETSLLRETVPSIPSSHTSNSENKISEKNKSLPETEASISNETHISDSSKHIL
ncbi:5583_t:CDS:2, partial [Entrophospora sp. SA101]